MPRPNRDPYTLTPRQRQVLALYMQGMTYQAIADMLHIKARTVNTTLDRCQLDLHLESREALRLYARLNDLDKVEQVSFSQGECPNCGHDWTAHGPYIANGAKICVEVAP
jgi:DNA-binding CsgD family transcriptional regulator